MLKKNVTISSKLDWVSDPIKNKDAKGRDNSKDIPIRLNDAYNTVVYVDDKSKVKQVKEQFETLLALKNGIRVEKK